MTIQYNQPPTYTQSLLTSGVTNRAWYRFFTDGLFSGTPPSGEVPVTLTTSPFTYIAPSRGFVIVRGGTVSALQFMRVGTYLLPGTSGVFPLSKGDSLVLTYSALPTLVFVPQ